MIRILLLAVTLLSAALTPIASAHGVENAHAARAIEIIEIMNEANGLTPTLPVPKDPEAYAAALNAIVEGMRADRTRLEDLLARLHALPELPHGDDPQLHFETTTLQNAAIDVIGAVISIGYDLEAFEAAFHSGDDAQFEAAQVRLRNGVLVSLESLVTTLRGLKVATAWGNRAEMAKIECVALVVENLLGLTRYRLGMAEMPEAGEQMKASAAAILDEVRIARSELEMDARTFGDDPLNPATSLVQANRVEWRMLEVTEQFANTGLALGDRMANKQATRAEIETGYGVLRGQMSEIQGLYVEASTLAAREFQ